MNKRSRAASCLTSENAIVDLSVAIRELGKVIGRA